MTAALLIVAGCSTVVDGHPHPAGSSAGDGTGTPGGTSAAPSPGGSSAPGECPASYVSPNKQRPIMRLNFRFSDDLSTVQGSEHIEFTPDRQISELVFRLTANTAPTVEEGNKIVVTAASADHDAGRYTFSRAGAAASTQGGLLHIPFPKPIPAGTTVRADVDFTVTLGRESFDRFGRTDHGGSRYAWFGSAQPLLAWERGYGWHTEDMALFPAESATSEAMRVDLSVNAPEADVVLMPGNPLDGKPDGNGRKTWTAQLQAARDVSVAVGPFSVSDTRVGDTRLRVGAYDPGVRDALVPEFGRAITELERYFGPFPFPGLSVARLPANGGGIEYPGSILMLDGSRMVAVHETAHQWFYGMVGDSQSQHPWLDEAFAQYAEQLVNQTPESPSALTVPGKVDSSTQSYGTDMNDYYFITYDKGAAALEAARRAAGEQKWDAAVRCYVNANAWQIAQPSDLAAAIAQLPAAVKVLEQAGALP